jgi:hypothetical protein
MRHLDIPVTSEKEVEYSHIGVEIQDNGKDAACRFIFCSGFAGLCPQDPITVMMGSLRKKAILCVFHLCELKVTNVLAIGKQRCLLWA